MKKHITILSAVILLLFSITGCSSDNNREAESNIEESVSNSVETDNSTAVDESQTETTTNEAEDSISQVFMTTDISSDGLIAVYEALGRPATGKTAIKLHMGEPGNTNFLSPELIRELTLSVDGTFVDGNTYYGGSRTKTEAHLQIAKDHGFTYAPVDILDTDGEISLPITGGNRLEEAIIGSHYEDYDFIISIAHFKGHEMAGFGGTFKNLAIGMASINGKSAIHREPGGSMFSSRGEVFLEKIVEYTKAVIDDRGDNIVYINVLNNLSIDCDCNSNAAHPEMEDIGILASLDPVALDKASVDLIYAAPEEQNKHLVQRIESLKGTHLLDYAEELGLGSQTYELVLIDD